MSYDKYATYAQAIDQPNNYYNEIDESIINDSLAYLDDKAQKIKTQPFEYFYEDIIKEILEVDFSKKLSVDDYKNLKEDSKECLEICNDFHSISSNKINSWLSSSFKVVDYLVLHIIQNINQEKPKTYTGVGIEKARYKQLSEYVDSNLSMVGTKLYALYDTRNQNEHRTRTNPDGSQQLIKPNRHKTRKMVVEYYPVIMKGLETAFSN